jgi:hypothetical protein
MTVRWITPPGNLGVIVERIAINLPLQADSDAGPVTFSLIAGNLPRGCRLSQGVIRGSPTEVRVTTENKFVIRATDGEDIADQTFILTIEGSDAPRWLTREGFLNVGKGENYFILDNERVDFQLEATDTDLIAGDVLQYYLVPNGGQLPPGLSLSRQGRITGFTDPIFSVETSSLGGFDELGYDISYFDKVEAKSNGYDSFLYDITTFDYNEPSGLPRRLSRFYSFIVAVSDGINEIRRLFNIWVVTEEFLKADNSIIQIDTNLFRADNNGFRTPIWITESNLGIYRANNYLTIYLDVYDPPSLSGTIAYLLKSTNPDGSPSELPPGMVLDSTTGEIAGRVPYQSRTTKTYTFTLQAIDFPSSLTNISYVLTGLWSNKITYTVNQAVTYNGLIYICLQQHRNQLPDAVDSIYWQSTVSSIDKTFFVEIIGEIDSAIEWITESDLGEIQPSQASTKSVVAESKLYGGRVIYEQVSGNLPPGLQLLGTGDIIGKVKKFGDNTSDGLSRFYDKFIDLENTGSNFLLGDIIYGSTSGAIAKIINISEDTSRIFYDYTAENPSTIFERGEIVTNLNVSSSVTNDSRFFTTSYDGGITSFDKVFKFSIKASDTANFADLIKEFQITVVSENTKTFTNLYAKAFQPREKRLEWINFITDSEIFIPNEIFRYGDTNFSTQNEIKVLMYAGIESVEAYKFVQAMSRNHYKKQLRFGDIKYAKAKDPESQEDLYEVIYVEIVDPYENGSRRISDVIDLPDYTNSKILLSYDSIKVDSDIPFVSDSDHQRIFPNSIRNMRRRIKNIGDRDRSFLPLWMRTIQDADFVESGYLAAMVICYAKPGKSEKIISRINNKTKYASRGVWDSVNNYRVGDSVFFDGNYYTATLNNSNKNPSVETNIWLKKFNFQSINFTVDRYIIDTIDGQIADKYLAFPQIGEKLP